MKTAHSYCEPLKNKFDPNFMKVMNLTAIKLAESIQGAQCLFLQSDEISILLHDYKSLASDAWFDYNKSKIETISSAIASVEFTNNSPFIWTGLIKSAYFDSRSFNLPENEVNNYFVARQRDCIKNSIQALGQTLYSHKELDRKNMSQVQDMCFEKGYNRNNLPVSYKRGRCIIKETYIHSYVGDEPVYRSKWVVDNNIPEFSQDKNYVEQYLAVNY
jgi:tRNA(His) 5'-end guanylyltransferase